MPKTVVLGLDGSQDSMRAISHAADQAGADGEIVVVHVRELLLGRVGGLPLRGNEDEIEMDVRRHVDVLRARGVPTRLVVVSAVVGEPANVIADTARKEGADLIVIGTRGHRQIASVVVGSVTHRLLHMTPCPVLVVPPGAAGVAIVKTRSSSALAGGS